MVNGNLRHGSGFGQAQVYGDAAPTFLVRFLRSPKCHATTLRAEVEFDRVASDIGLGRSRDIDSLAFIVVCPRHSVPPTNRAIAGRGGLGHSAETPANCAAVAGALDHLSHQVLSAYRRFSLLGLPSAWPTAAVSPAINGGLRRNICQVGLRRQPSSLVSRESNLAVNDDVELASASGLYVHRTTSSRIKPCLHTEGIWFVVSGCAIKDDDRHNSFLSLMNRTSAFERL